jgi:glucose/mannose transport system substrate-binding protein
MILRGVVMRSSFKWIRVAGVALAALVLPAACSDAPPERSEIKILHWWNAGGEHEALSALLDLFKRQNPTVDVVDVGVEGGSNEARGAIRNRMSLGLPTDTFLTNGGWGLMSWVLFTEDARDSKMAEIGAFSQDWLGQVPEPVRQAVSYRDELGSHVYAVPLNIHRINNLFYNKELFQRFEIDVADLTDLDAVFTVAEKIKKHNQAIDPPDPAQVITPIALGYGNMQTWTLALVFFENLLVSRYGGEWYSNLFWKPEMYDGLEPAMTYALEDFRKLISYTNSDADQVVWTDAMDAVLNGKAAMTIMGDWAQGYAKAAGYGSDTFGFIPMPGIDETFVFTTDTFGLTKGAENPDDTLKLLHVFGSKEGQQTFNLLKGSISARMDVEVPLDDDRRPTFDAFHDSETLIVPATSILVQQTYVDAISAALANFAREGPNGSASEVQHALDNHSDILFSSCWPVCLRPMR